LAAAALAGFFQFEQSNARSEEEANHAAAEALADTYVRLLQLQYTDLSKEYARGELNQLICEGDSSNIERQRRFRALHPPSEEVVAYYRSLTVAVTNVTVSTNTGEFTITEQHPSGPQYQRYTIEKHRGDWRLCSPD
jgi:hypothetical protein